MSRERRRLSATALTVAAVLVLAFPSAPSSPAQPHLELPRSSVRELKLLRELSAWVQESPADRVGSFAGQELHEAVRTRRLSFEVFRSFASDEAQSRFLAGLPYGRAIHQAADRFGVDGLLLAAVVKTESSFHPGVVSARGALGLTQLMPSTAALFRIVDPLDPRSNLEGGARYLRSLLESFGGDITLALAAYNAGPGNVARYGGLPPFPETKRYVEKVLSTYVEFHRRLWERHEIAELVALR